MAKGREKSDGRIVPKGRRKAAPTARSERGGKAATASEQVGQLGLFRGTADSPQGAGGDGGVGVPAPKRRSVPKPRTTTGPLPPTMTMRSSPRSSSRCFWDSCGSKGRCRNTFRPNLKGAQATRVGKAVGTPASRRAVCEDHKYGSVRGAPW